MKKLFLLGFMIVLSGGISWAQTNDENQDIFNDVGKSEENQEDTSTSANPGEGETKKPAKPFIRMVLPLDTITQLVTYSEIIEQSESSSDSLYKRVKRWAMEKFAKEGEKPKDLFEVDNQNSKVVIKGYIDAFVYINKYSKRNMGYHDFRMYVWIKEGRYRYTITNLVNENKLFPGDKELPTRTYFEYYNTTTVNPKGADSIVRSADADIKKLIESFKKAMADPIIVDEDDW